MNAEQGLKAARDALNEIVGGMSDNGPRVIAERALAATASIEQPPEDTYMMAKLDNCVASHRLDIPKNFEWLAIDGTMEEDLLALYADKKPSIKQPEVASVSSLAFEDLLSRYVCQSSRERYASIISHIDAHCAQQVVEWKTAANSEARLGDEWRARAIAAEAQLAARIELAATPVMEKYPGGWDGVDVNCQQWLKEQPDGTRLYAAPQPIATADQTKQDLFANWCKQKGMPASDCDESNCWIRYAFEAGVLAAAPKHDGGLHE